MGAVSAAQTAHGQFASTGIVISPYIYRHFAVYTNIGHSSVGYRHDHLINGGKFNVHWRGIVPTLIHAGLRFKALLFVVVVE